MSMHKTLRISFSLKNTYRVNSILYSLKQIPLIKKLFPEKLYSVRGCKIFANVLSAVWEVISVFLGKFLYFLTMVAGMATLYMDIGLLPQNVFLHIFLFLTVIGAFMNTNLFNPSRDKYYAIILMRMDARSHTLVNYGYALLKLIVGSLPFSLLFGLKNGVPLWLCFLLPFSVASVKLVVAASSLWDYERRGLVYNENRLGKFLWLAVFLLLGAAYGLPAAGIALPWQFCAAFMVAAIPVGVLGAWKIHTFSRYREIYQQLLARSMQQMDSAAELSQKISQKAISTDTGITSRKKGFEYLNELFIKRHQKILWKSSRRIALICLLIVVGCLLVFYFLPDIREKTNELLMTSLPYFVFIMYAVNRGTGFTKALFMNCDHSLLTYSFYKQPRYILKLFQIRLREIVKINLLPALVIGAGLSILLYCSGGTEDPINYGILFVSILCMSVFFSVHYLVLYYLLQPYNAGTEMRSGTYQIALSATYFVCFFMMRLQMPTQLFGLLCIFFCVLYSVVACFLIFIFAPRTFRLRP